MYTKFQKWKEKLRRKKKIVKKLLLTKTQKKVLAGSQQLWNQGVVGGRGGGKTFLALIYPFFKAAEIYKKTGKLTAHLHIQPTTDMLYFNFVAKLTKEYAKIGVHWQWLSKNYKVIKLYNAKGFSTIIILKSAENHLTWRGLAGFDEYILAGATIDQAEILKNKSAYDSMLQLLREVKDPYVLLLANPPLPGLQKKGGGMTNLKWIYDIYDSEKNQNSGYKLYEGVSAYENDALENKIEYIEMMKRELGKTYARALVYGERVLFIGGRLFWAWESKEIREKVLIETPPIDWTATNEISLVFDFNYSKKGNKPATCLLACYHDRVLYILKNYRYYSCGTRKSTQRILTDIKNSGFSGFILIDGDAAGRTSRSSSESKHGMNLSDYDIVIDEFKKFKAAGLNVEYKLVASTYNASVKYTADCASNAMENGRLKIWNIKEMQYLISDLESDPLDEKEREKWKNNTPEASHNGDELRYIATRYFDIRATKVYETISSKYKKVR